MLHTPPDTVRNNHKTRVLVYFTLCKKELSYRVGRDFTQGHKSRSVVSSAALESRMPDSESMI